MKPAAEPMIDLREVAVQLGGDATQGVRFSLPSFAVAQGEHIALTGPSGCGKSTLLNLISGLRRPDAGSVKVAGTELTGLSEAALDRHRGQVCGHVFQSFHLLSPFTALENVMIGLRLAGYRRAECRQLAEAALDRVGLAERRRSRPATLSVGERQRVAIARAIAPDPPLLLADEPTGSLDATTGGEIFDLLRDTAVEAGRTFIMVTHDEALAAAMPQRFDCSALVSAVSREKGAAAA